jgi:hypothetical protein
VLALFLLVPLGFHLAGLPGGLVGFILADAGRYLMAATGAAMRGVQAWANDALLSALVAATAWIGYLAGTSLDARFGKFAGFAGAGGVTLVVFGALALRYLRTERALAQPWRPSVAPEA